MSPAARSHRRGVLAQIRRGVVALLVALLSTAVAVIGPAERSAAANLPSGTYLFAALEDNRLVAIDRTTEQVVGSVTLPGISAFPNADLQTSPDQSTVYVVNGATIIAVDTRTMTITRSFSDPTSAFFSFSVSTDGTRLYAATFAGWVDVLQLPSLTLLGGPVTVGTTPGQFARQIVANANAGFVVTSTAIKAVSPDGAGVAATAPLAGSLGSIAGDDTALYAVQEGVPSTVAVLDPHIGVQFSSLSAPAAIGNDSMTLSPDGQYLYVDSQVASGNVQRLAVATGLTSVAEIRVAAGTPIAAPDTGTVYVPLPTTPTHIAKIVDWPTVTTLPVPAAAQAVTMVDLAAFAPGAPTVTTLTNGDGQVTVGLTPGTRAAARPPGTGSRRPTSPTPPAAGRPPPRRPARSPCPGSPTATPTPSP